MKIEEIFREFGVFNVDRRGYSPLTIKRYLQVAGLFARFAHLEDFMDASRESIDEYFLHGVQQIGWKASTYQKNRYALRFFFAWAVEFGFAKENIADHIPPKRIPRGGVKRALRKREAEILLDAIRTNKRMSSNFSRLRGHAIFATFLFAGLRRSELLKLELRDIDLQDNELLVRHGKGGKDRLIPIVPTLANILGSYLESRQKRGYQTPFVFVALIDDKPMSLCSLDRLVKIARRASGIKFHLHQLRHTFATLMLEGECDLFVLSKLLGHSSVRTTEIYLSATIEHLRSQAMKHPLNSSSSESLYSRRWG